MIRLCGFVVVQRALLLQAVDLSFTLFSVAKAPSKIRFYELYLLLMSEKFYIFTTLLNKFPNVQTILRHNEVYTWNNVNTCVHNIIVGQLWIEQVSNFVSSRGKRIFASRPKRREKPVPNLQQQSGC